MEAGINAGINAGQKSGVQFKSGLNIKLPQRLISEPDDFSDELDSITGWTGSAGSTIEVNTTQFKSGTASLKFTTASAGTYASFTKQFTSKDLSASEGKNLRFWVYLHSLLTTTASINIKFYTNYPQNNRYTTSLANNTAVGLVQNEWKLNYDQARTWADYAGTPNWANINAVQLLISKAEGEVVQMSFDLLRSGINLKKSILFMFDDGYDTDLTVAYPILAEKGYVATSYIVGSTIGTADHMSAAQLLYLNSKGWDMADHTENHPLAPNDPVQYYIDQMEGGMVRLNNLGLTRASKDVGYTGSAFCPNWQTAIAEWGGLTGREGGDNTNIYEIGWPHNLHCATNINTTSAATIKSQIDRALNRGGTPILVFHKLVVSNPTLYQLEISKFQEAVDYAYLLGLQSLTISEYRRLSDSAITVHHK